MIPARIASTSSADSSARSTHLGHANRCSSSGAVSLRLSPCKMRSLPALESERLEGHLLICSECRDRLTGTDEYVGAMKAAAGEDKGRGTGEEGAVAVAGMRHTTGLVPIQLRGAVCVQRPIWSALALEC